MEQENQSENRLVRMFVTAEQKGMLESLVAGETANWRAEPGSVNEQIAEAMKSQGWMERAGASPDSEAHTAAFLLTTDGRRALRGATKMPAPGGGWAFAIPLPDAAG